MTHKYQGPNLLYEESSSLAFNTTYSNYFFDQRNGQSGSGIWLHAVPDSVSLKKGSRDWNKIRLDFTRVKKPNQVIEIFQQPP